MLWGKIAAMVFIDIHRRMRSAVVAAALLTSLAALGWASSDLARAQGLSKAFGGFAASPDQPIDIQAGRLDVDDNAKRAVFTGKVVARQDTFVMNSETLEVRYAGRKGAKKADTAGLGGGSTEITHLTARGDVFIQSLAETTQTARGNWAEFDVKKRIITMGDLVTLKQGKNVIRGTRLVIDLTTGRSSVQSKSPTGTAKSGGRIRMVITPDKALRRGLQNQRGTSRPKRQTQRKTSASSAQRGTRGDQ